ncbi:MAG: hypothetical protein HWN65_05490 [Candidatus Helarchaeota archaeon]|nr:hypothetical protein [Candidatus Helarchaeota archaeon]
MKKDTIILFCHTCNKDYSHKEAESANYQYVCPVCKNPLKIKRSRYIIEAEIREKKKEKERINRIKTLRIVFNALIDSGFVDQCALIFIVQSGGTYKGNADATIANFLIEQFNNDEEYIRGKALTTLGKLIMKRDFWDDSLLTKLLSFFDDGAYWIREVAAEIIRHRGEKRPRMVFQTLADFLVQNIEDLPIKDPVSGIQMGDYVVRILFRIYRKHSLREEFEALIKRLRDVCAANAGQSVYNISQIVRFFTSYVKLEWDAELDRFHSLPKMCATCVHWSPHQVPLPYLRAYLKSEAHQKWQYTDEDLSMEDNYDEEGEWVLGPVAAEDGELCLLDELRWLWLYGFSKKQFRMTEASGSCTQYEPRPIELPYALTLIVPQYRYILVKLDAKMFNLVKGVLSVPLTSDGEELALNNFETCICKALPSAIAYLCRSFYHEPEAFIVECKKIVWDTEDPDLDFAREFMEEMMEFSPELEFLTTERLQYYDERRDGILTTWELEGVMQDHRLEFIERIRDIDLDLVKKFY